MTSATFVTVPLANSAPAARQDLPDQALLTTESVRCNVAGPVTLSIIAPLFNAQQTLPRFHRRLADAMEHVGVPFELVLVNDGSTTDTGDIRRVLPERDSHVLGITISRNFGHQAAISGGLQASRAWWQELCPASWPLPGAPCHAGKERRASRAALRCTL